MTPEFEHLVVGKGMIGAAALRHLAAASERVGAIGPDEPLDAATHRGVFSSHYDQGRIVSQLSRDETWGRLVARTLPELGDLELAGDRPIYRPGGVLFMAPEGDPSLREIVHRARSLEVAVSAGDAALRSSGLRLPPGFAAVLEHPPAGIIDPRALVRAQLVAAGRDGAAVVRETVVAVRRLAGHWRITGESGRHYTARNVLLSVGAYINCFDLLPRKLAVRVKSETTILLEVADREARRLGAMPSVSYRIESASLSGVYVVPPLRYPDGRQYLKLGADTDTDAILPDFATIQAWMTAGGDVVRRDLRDAILDLIPDLAIVSARVKRCLVTYSAHGLPYVDRLDDGLFVAAAGNGAAAACSDTLGWLAALLMLDRPWPAEFERSAFERRFAGARAGADRR